MSNYPPGSDNKLAPWNEKYAGMPEFEAETDDECKICYRENVPVNNKCVCEQCFVPETVEPDEEF